MKLNRKGFLLAETIITVTIIATLATSMYLYISRTANRFEDRNNYENVTDVYKVNTVKLYLNEKNLLTNTGDITEQIVPIKDELNINKVYLILNTEEAKNSIDTDSNSLKDYLDWISIDGNQEDLRLIVWFNGGDSDGTFANMRIVK